MKRFVITSIGILFAILLSDFLLIHHQAYEMEKRLGGTDYFQLMTSRVTPGMSRSAVEHEIRGFRRFTIEPEEEGYTISYQYWFGFLPPLSSYGLKLVGEIQALYSTDDHLIKTSYWYN